MPKSVASTFEVPRAQRIVMCPSPGHNRKAAPLLGVPPASAAALSQPGAWLALVQAQRRAMHENGHPADERWQCADRLPAGAGWKSRIQKKASVDTLRHSHAPHLIGEGVSIRLIQNYLGHQSLETTMIYQCIRLIMCPSLRTTPSPALFA